MEKKDYHKQPVSPQSAKPEKVVAKHIPAKPKAKDYVVTHADVYLRELLNDVLGASDKNSSPKGGKGR